MTLNPIGDKLAKMFGKKKKQAYSTSTEEATIFTSTEISRIFFSNPN